MVMMVFTVHDYYVSVATLTLLTSMNMVRARHPPLPYGYNAST